MVYPAGILPGGRRIAVETKYRSYRVTTPTIAMSCSDGQVITVTVPINGIVTTSVAPDGNQIVDVVWNGKNYTMFTQDLRDRGELIE
jgi:hypothetical protein